LAALEVVLLGDVCATKATGIVIGIGVFGILVFARRRLIHVGVGNDRDGEENREKDVLEHDDDEGSTGRCRDAKS